MNIQIKKLDPSRLNDYMHFFDDIGFCDNPSWSLCYCCYYYLDDEEESEEKTIEEIRASIRAYAMDRIRKGKLNGFLAYSEGEPVGWCNADVKTIYKRVMDNDKIPNDEEYKVGSIVCFVVDPNHRGKGIASVLLEEACAYFIQENYDFIEAYPAKTPNSPAENYHGPTQMYLNHGFEIIKELDRFRIVRKSINKV